MRSLVDQFRASVIEELDDFNEPIVGKAYIVSKFEFEKAMLRLSVLEIEHNILVTNEKR